MIKNKCLKILISAYACEPLKGSEPGVGWNTVVEMSRLHEIWVITRANNQSIIESYLGKEKNLNLHFIYYDLPRWIAFWKRGRCSIYLYYYIWQIGIYFRAKRLIGKIKFDLIHHVTFGTYWLPCFLSLLPIPFIWGVVGGGESTPKSFYKEFSLKNKIYEKSRNLIRTIGEHDPFVRITAQKCKYAFAATGETKQRLKKLGVNNILVVPQTAFNLNDEKLIFTLSEKQNRISSTIRFISIGRFLGWKGFHLGLQAFAKASISYSEYWLVVGKKDIKELKKMVSNFGIAHKIKYFYDLPELDDVYKLLVQCDVLIHPASHEAFGTVVLEAMIAGRPVICLDRGGPALQVTKKTGIKVTSHNPKNCVNDIADAMLKLWKNIRLVQQMGAESNNRAKTYFTWDKRRCWLNDVYQAISKNELFENKYFRDL